MDEPGQPPAVPAGAAAHAELLAEFVRTYRLRVRDVVFEFLGLRMSRRMLCWLLEPVVYTLERRRNLFRAAFSVAAGDAIRQQEQGVVAAAAGEIGWTCALMLDDILDRSIEREGHAAAHVAFGRARTLAAVVAALMGAMWSGAATRRVGLSVRLRMEWLGVRLLVVCALSALRRPRGFDMRAYVRHARNINNSTHWAVLAPLTVGSSERLRRAARTYADAASLNGKLRNDLLDYCGGSSESETVFKDFHARVVSFPVLILLERPLTPADRSAVIGHFGGRAPSALTPEDLCALLARSGALARYLEVMRENAAQAYRAADSIEAAGADAEKLASLMRRWTRCVIDVATEATRSIAEGERVRIRAP
jgi:geranylgeranyl pyrophosphate synthase